jgi:hypothetical protein
MKKSYEVSDAIAIALYMGSDKYSYSALSAAEMAPAAATAVHRLIYHEDGEDPEWPEVPGGDWETFMWEYVKAINKDGHDECATVGDYKKTLLCLMTNKKNLKRWIRFLADRDNGD